ncbi:hypothetical protein ACEPPU_07285 [Priestia aryabhattai]|uniref:hypothetical protein n=1 Tax=Priestia aryabhattai TaxID=412384 RepID=UPI0035ABE7EE
MLKIITGKYVQIPNVAFGFGTDYKLNTDELKVFAYLQWMKTVGTMTIRTHATIIVEDLNWTTTKASRDNARVATALESLRDKGYITLSFKSDARKDALAIEINIKEMKEKTAESTVGWKQNPFTFSGYTEVSKDEYNLAVEHDYHLTVMAYYKWRANAKFTYAIADQEWAEVFELKTVKQARAIISDCDFLIKISGDKYQDENGQWKQETNQYVMEKDMKTSDKLEKVDAENKKTTFLEKQREKVTDLFVKLDEETFNQIFDKKTYIEFKGYKAWKETDCKVVKEAGRKKIDAVMKTKGAFNIERLEKKYEESLEHERQQEIAMKRTDERLENGEIDEEWTSSFKKKEKKSTFLDFMDDDTFFESMEEDM